MRERAGRYQVNRLSASVAAVGLLLGACAGDSDAELPTGAEMPSEYRYQVLIAEENYMSVYMYTDTEPTIETQNRITVLAIDGQTFCPPEGAQYGVEEEQTYRRDFYCSGDGVYADFVAVVGNGRASVIDRGAQDALQPETSIG